MISERLFNELNKQMNFEFYSAHLYLAMSAYCAAEDFDGFSNFFKVQAEEEKFHAMKFYNYINEMNGRLTLEGMSEPQNDYETLLDVFNIAYAHEKVVTSNIYNLTDIATEEKEHATISLLKWFIDEQVEEESNFNGLIKRLARINADPTSIYMLDNELATRVFVPPVTK
ncbi:ferritin [Clostridium sp. CM028]|uniref:ferritin n=1 Tax=Clostridium TaxID=1485 RepID=UPI0013EEB636|nr:MULTISPECIES: ferritin [Clostridium]MBU3091075.1 ferritin [Clostridium sp. CF011]MBW9144944.1 ferritin [Clostridium sp. CM027]MBW9148637.1 ferritin [Clostridium sp. CM028]MBZ9609686.1 ferritin [Clostridium estertheticum]UVE40083.1 ferritin [Clostridium sp. CM027]